MKTSNIIYLYVFTSISTQCFCTIFRTVEIYYRELFAPLVRLLLVVVSPSFSSFSDTLFNLWCIIQDQDSAFSFLTLLVAELLFFKYIICWAEIVFEDEQVLFVKILGEIFVYNVGIGGTARTDELQFELQASWFFTCSQFFLRLISIRMPFSSFPRFSLHVFIPSSILSTEGKPQIGMFHSV